MVVLVAPLLTAVVGPYGRIDRPPVSEPQRWTLDADSMDRATSPTGLDVTAAVDVGNGRVVNIAGAIGGGGSRARVAPPEDAGTKTGQTRTVKAGIDGGCIRAHFKWKTREAKWALDGASVEWSLDKATSSEADALRRTVAAIKRERERDPVASGNTYVRPEEAFAREIGFIDDDIGETERRIAEGEKALRGLRADRAKCMSDRAEAVARAAAEAAAKAAMHARIDAIVEHFISGDGKPPPEMK